MTWPAPILSARRKLNTRSTEDPNVFLTMISTAELQKEGVKEAEIFSEQDRYMGERLAGWLKIGIWDEFVKTLQGFFDGDRQFPLDESLQDFAAAMAVAVDVDAAGDTLPDRIEFTGDALDALHDMSSRNTCVGNALSGWPKGKKLVQDLQAYTSKLNLTDELVKQVEGLASQLSSTVGSIGGSLLTCELEEITKINQTILELAKVLSRDKSLIVGEFMPEKSDKAIALPIQTLLQNLLPAAWEVILGGLLANACDSKALVEWSLAVPDKCERMMDIQTLVTSKLLPLVGEEHQSDFSKAAESHKCCSWLLGLATELQNSFQNQKTCDSLWSGRTGFLKFVSELPWSTSAFAKSPLMCVDGDCMGDLCDMSWKPLIDDVFHDAHIVSFGLMHLVIVKRCPPTNRRPGVLKCLQTAVSRLEPGPWSHNGEIRNPGHPWEVATCTSLLPERTRGAIMAREIRNPSYPREVATCTSLLPERTPGALVGKSGAPSPPGKLRHARRFFPKGALEHQGSFWLQAGFTKDHFGGNSGSPMIILGKLQQGSTRIVCKLCLDRIVSSAFLHQCWIT